MANRNLTRRQFVSTVTMGAGTILLGNAALSFPVASSDLSADPLQIVKLGNTGLKTTLLGMGTGFSGYNHSSNITRAGVAEPLIRQAYEKGIRFFDCADSYGTHPHTAAALKGIPRESYTLGSKMWIRTGNKPDDQIPDADVLVERFRKELNTDYIDLVQFHCMEEPDWPIRYRKQMDSLENLKTKKIIRAHGVSIHSLEALEACVGNPWVDIVHVRINPYGAAMDKSDPSLIVPVIEKLHKEGKGIIGMKLVGNGEFKDDSEKIDNSLKYVLGLGTVDMIIIGFELPEQIDNYMGRMRKVLNVKL
jgi:aryl-alcohol dehydrogenase-like predicted oxidoreductase